MSKEITPWIEPFRVRSYEIEPHGRASLQSMCNYMQEAAGNHAQSLDISMEHLAPLGLTWVLSRIHVQVETYPVWHEALQVTTWPSSLGGLYATREFLLHDTAERVIARGSSAWLMIDLNRRRPVRLPAFLLAYRVPDRPRALDTDFAKLRPPTGADLTRRFHVRYSDLDLNAHVNNVRYIEWAVETLPLDRMEAQQPAEIEIHFRAETGYDEVVRAEALATDTEGVYWHRLRRESDERDVAVARTRWIAREG